MVFIYSINFGFNFILFCSRKRLVNRMNACTPILVSILKKYVYFKIIYFIVYLLLSYQVAVWNNLVANKLRKCNILTVKIFRLWFDFAECIIKNCKLSKYQKIESLFIEDKNNKKIMITLIERSDNWVFYYMSEFSFIAFT